MWLNRLALVYQYLQMLVLELVQGSSIVSSLMMLKLRQVYNIIWFGIHNPFWNCNFICFILQENAVVIHAIVGWKSSIGRWARVQASLEIPIKNQIVLPTKAMCCIFCYLCVVLRIAQRQLEWCFSMSFTGK